MMTKQTSLQSSQWFTYNTLATVVNTRRMPVQRAVERDEIPYPYKVHDTTLHSRA